MKTETWYAHIVGHFERNLHGPLQVSSSLGARLELAFGPGPVEYVASTYDDVSAGAAPHNVGRQADGTAASATDAMHHVRAIGPETLISRVYLKHTTNRKQRWVDYLWDLRYDSEEDYQTSQLDAALLTSVRLDQFIHKLGSCTSAGRALIDDLVSLTLEAGEAYHLMVDLAELSETGADGVYHKTNTQRIGPRSYSRELTRQLWQTERQNRRRLVPGVFWANYFSAYLLDRLGGRESFRDRYLAQAKENVRWWRNLVTDAPGGGLIVKTTDDPGDDLILRIGIANAAWLHRELRSIGALL